jgi:hypothetical protein
MVDGYHSTNLSQQLDKAETLSDVMEAASAEMSVNRAEKYDTSLSDDLSRIELNPLLSEKEIEDAKFWINYADHDVFLLHGALGSGKGTIGNRTIKLFSWYYKKNVILDYRPRELFDMQYKPKSYDVEYNNPHEPILVKHTDYMYFDKKQFIDQIARMADVSLGALADDANPELEKVEKSKADEVRRVAGLWISQYGMVFLQNGILGLDEIKRYHHKRNSNNPFGRMLILLYDLLRHAHLCVVGMTAYYEELDDLEFLPKVTVEIQCHKSELNQHTVLGDTSKVQWQSGKSNRYFKKIKKLVVDGREPWDLLGNYVHTELAQDVDEGVLNSSKSMRKTDIILLKDTTGFRDENGVAWLGNEYIGYGLRTDAEGYIYEKGNRSKNVGVPNALIGVYRRMNWRINHCEPEKHRAGTPVFTGMGVFDTYNSWSAFGLPVSKGLLK